MSLSPGVWGEQVNKGLQLSTGSRTPAQAAFPQAIFKRHDGSERCPGVVLSDPLINQVGVKEWDRGRDRGREGERHLWLCWRSWGEGTVGVEVSDISHQMKGDLCSRTAQVSSDIKRHTCREICNHISPFIIQSCFCSYICIHILRPPHSRAHTHTHSLYLQSRYVVSSVNQTSELACVRLVTDVWAVAQ